MTAATAEFFDDLGRRGHEPLLESADGSLRFDLADGDEVEHWLVRIHKGDVSVSREKAGADCVVGADKALFDAVASGEANAMAAVLRGALRVDGEVELLVLIQRLLPGPPGSQRSRRPAPAAGGSRER